MVSKLFLNTDKSWLWSKNSKNLYIFKVFFEIISVEYPYKLTK